MLKVLGRIGVLKQILASYFRVLSPYHFAVTLLEL
jgi:hypothetical protein